MRSRLIDGAAPRGRRPGSGEVSAASLGRRRVWATFFWGRHLGAATLALLALLGPFEVGNRRAVATLLLLVVLPYGVIVHLYTRSRGRAPRALVVVDGIFAPVFAAVSPELWAAALVCGVGLIGVFAVLLGPRAGAAAAVIETSAFLVAASAWQLDGDVGVALVTFVVAVPIVAVLLGTAVTAERGMQERLTELVDTIEAIVWEADPRTLAFTYVSGHAEALLGYGSDDWISVAGFWEGVIHPDDRTDIVRACREATSRGEDHVLEYRMVRRDGTVVWVHDAVSVDTDEEGNPAAMRGVIVDITDRKTAEAALETSEARYRELFDNANDVVYTMSLDGIILSLNATGRRILGYEEPEIVGRSVNLIIAPEYREMSRGKGMEKVEGGGSTTYEVECLTKDGRRIPTEVSSRLVYEDGKAVAIQGIARDITLRRRAQSALEESERRYADAYERERMSVERLRAADEVKNTFLQAVSHELRTPLTSVVGFADTIARRDADLSAEQRHDLLGRLIANARRLERMLADLLDLDRLDRGIVTPNYQPTNVGRLAIQVAEQLTIPADWHLRVEADAVWAGLDGPKVERIIENLLSNAVRHTPRGTTIVLAVRAVSEGVLISCEDDGPGVPADLRDSIFQPFAQGPQPSEHSPGVGIGLSLVTRFAQIHGGRAWVEESAQGGAAFHVLLPDGLHGGEGTPPERAAQ